MHVALRWGVALVGDISTRGIAHKGGDPRNMGHRSSPRYGLEEPVSVAECYTSTFDSTKMPEGIEYGSKSEIGMTRQEFRDLGVCLRCYTIG